MTSKTTSTWPTPSNGSASRSTNASAPRSIDEVAVGGPAGGDHPGARLAGELDGDRADPAGGAVDQHALAGREPPVVEQSLPRGEPRDRQRRRHVWSMSPGRGARLRASTAMYSAREPLRAQSRQAEHALADGEAGGAEAQLGDDPGQLVAGHAGGAVAAGTVDPGAGPRRVRRG